MLPWASLLVGLLPCVASLLAQPPIRSLARNEILASTASRISQKPTEQQDANSPNARKQPHETVTQWCHSWAERSSALVHTPGFLTGVNRRSCVPFMVMTTTRPTAIQSQLRNKMHPHREARRELANQLKQVDREMLQWWDSCVGDECVVHHEKLRAKASILRQELDHHRQVLQQLEDERLAKLQSTCAAGDIYAL